MTHPYVWFIATLLICVALVRFMPGLDRAMSHFAAHRSSIAFPTRSPYEYNKLALLRIVFGLVIVTRAINVFDHLLFAERYSAVGLWAAAELIAGAQLIIGFASQWSLLFLVGGMWQFGDVAVGKSTLGNDVGAMLATLLFIANAGKFLSLDSILVKRHPAAHAFLLYYRGIPTNETLFFAKLSALGSYWAVCVYSVAVHLNEPAWMDGSAGPLLLSNNFMSRWHDYFAALFQSSELAVALARGSLWLMMLWYPLVLPGVLSGGWLRRYVIIWGWLFFALSLFILQLGSLAEIEVILWLALFWSVLGLDPARKLAVLYDDRCNLCDRTIQAITLLDVFGRTELRPLSQNKPLLNEIGLSMNLALTDLYGVRSQDGRLFRGYEFYIQLSQTLVLLWPLLPILLLGKLVRVGPLAYRSIAERRTRLFGVCESPRRKFIRPVGTEIVTRSSAAKYCALHVSMLVGFYFASVPAQHLGWSGIPNVVADAAHIYGITPIDVFNKTDLRMAENWFVLRSMEFNENLPVFAEDGSRLPLHVSDRIYFGHTLRFRRGVIGMDGCHFLTWKPTMEYISRAYLQRHDAPAGTYRFTYRQYHSDLASAKNIVRNKFLPSAVSTPCELEFGVTHRK